jgi:decaprenyl-phosphate phosphoribosyltransferase
MIRAIAGEVVSGFHIPVWLRLTLFFMSLFVAAIKRNAELSISGSESRQTLAKYNKHFLDFLTYTFATATIIAYSLYAYNIYDNIEPAPHGYSFLKQIISDFNPGTENRKLMTATIPIVVYAIARYGQLFYTRIEGERPEKIIISDVPLLGAMAIWGAMVIALIYLL